MSDTSSAENTVAPASQRVRRQVEDALELANFAVSTGAKGADGQPLSFDDIETIQFAAAQFGLIDIPVEPNGTLTIDQWNKFEKAYHRLASAMSPVTAETLRDTRDTARPPGHYAHLYYRVRDYVWGYSPAQRFTRELWFLTFFLVGAIIALEWGINYLGLKKDAVSVAGWRYLWQSLVPWAYGALGACAFLLRSAHFFIHQRTFDTRRTPEYFNRILLGAISGGGIILFTEYLTSADDGSVAHLGAAALGFVAGYSGDLLFNLVERVVNAIFPKTPEDDTRKAAKGNPPPAPQNNEPDPGDKPADQNGAKPTTQ
jgi:hypothetical protein